MIGKNIKAWRHYEMTDMGLRDINETIKGIVADSFVLEGTTHYLILNGKVAHFVQPFDVETVE